MLSNGGMAKCTGGSVLFLIIVCESSVITTTAIKSR